VRPGGVRVVSIGVSRGLWNVPQTAEDLCSGRMLSKAVRTCASITITITAELFTYDTARVLLRPRFYVWAYNPWARPVYWSWGWGRAPWFYGGYFAPAPYYVSASLWLTDFIIAENLRAHMKRNKKRSTRIITMPLRPDAGYYQSDPNDYNNSGNFSAPSVRPLPNEVQRQLDCRPRRGE